MAFSCGARSASELKKQGYLRSMLSRRQLQGFVGQRRGRQARPYILSIDWIINNLALAVTDFKPEGKRTRIANLPALDFWRSFEFPLFSSIYNCLTR
jgi:hypothetical protein